MEAFVACEPWHRGGASAMKNPDDVYEVLEIAPRELLLPRITETCRHMAGYT